MLLPLIDRRPEIIAMLNNFIQSGWIFDIFNTQGNYEIIF